MSTSQTPPSLPSQSNTNPQVQCGRQPEYKRRLRVDCADPHCTVPNRTHYVYIRRVEVSDSKEEWHLDIYRNLPDHIRCPKEWWGTTSGATIGGGCCSLIFPGYEGPKGSHGPMEGNNLGMESLYWSCWACDRIWPYKRYRTPKVNKCYYCESKDLSCRTWYWGSSYTWDCSPKNAVMAECDDESELRVTMEL